MRAARLALLGLAACGGAPKPAAPARLPATPALRHVAGAACDPANDGYECGSDGSTVLKCSASTWRLAGRCEGPSGCVSSANKVKCDDSIAEIGLVCATEGSAACSRDKKTLLACRGGTMAADRTCRGPAGCDAATGTPRCDATIAEPGDPCGANGEAACTPDGRSLVECRDHAMAIRGACTGGCTVHGTEITCR